MLESGTEESQENYPSIPPQETTATDTRKELFVLDQAYHPRGLQSRIQDAAGPTCESPSSALGLTCTPHTSVGRSACAGSGIVVPIPEKRH